TQKPGKRETNREPNHLCYNFEPVALWETHKLAFWRQPHARDCWACTASVLAIMSLTVTSKMTFDPDTAHPRIVLSSDNTEMHTTDNIQNVPDNPGRYDVILAALGATGYSTGRHYWEVSVAGKSCFHIGMASEAAPRKGSLRFNPANGFWTIVLNKQGQYRALDRRPVPILTQTQPVTLGILLDYKKGQISFYDTGARSHLYSFVGQSFTDKIYPFSDYCVESGENSNPIILVSPGSLMESHPGWVRRNRSSRVLPWWLIPLPD
uniref:B30.2/SPRY domain-containing protein n=1 Tax=Acanthochromis polyacanthus TaxID=80966 RepID=A0A3Q1HN38_9TELE